MFTMTVIPVVLIMSPPGVAQHRRHDSPDQAQHGERKGVQPYQERQDLRGLMQRRPRKVQRRIVVRTLPFDRQLGTDNRDDQ